MWIYCAFRVNRRSKSSGYIPTGFTLKNSTYCPRCIYLFCMDLRANSDFYLVQHEQICVVFPWWRVFTARFRTESLYEADMFCLQRVKPSFKFQKQGSPHYWEVFKAHTDPRNACGFRNSVPVWCLLQNSAGSKQKSYEIMTMKMFAPLDKTKPNTGNIRDLNWAAVKRTTV